MALGQSHDCPSASEVALKYMGKTNLQQIVKWIMRVNFGIMLHDMGIMFTTINGENWKLQEILEDSSSPFEWCPMVWQKLTTHHIRSGS